MLRTHISLGTAIEPAILKSAEEGREKMYMLKLTVLYKQKWATFLTVFSFFPI